jgi:predicted ribosome quality control (RQC) complex YloA/Tae2 family protein
VDNATLNAVCDELRPVLVGQRFGKVFPIARRRLAIDFRLPDPRYLFIGIEPLTPRLYLIKRRLKDLERASGHSQPFHLLLKKHLSGAEVVSITKPSDERVVTLRFAGTSELGETTSLQLVIQLTGKSSNLFLLDDTQIIRGSLIDKDLDGQRFGETYEPPSRASLPAAKTDRPLVTLTPEDNGSISSALDRFYSDREAEESFRLKAAAARREVDREISKRRKLIDRLTQDMLDHGDAEKWKRYGDLILANISNAKRYGDKIAVIDYFDDAAPEIDIEVDENLSLTDAAQEYFRKYTKAQNAATEIDRRIATVKRELEELERVRERIEEAVREHDDSFFGVSEKPRGDRKLERKDKKRFTGARQFTSSDGFEILVGKKAVDNDHLTFRVAGSLDTWLHAADYPGSHVIIRNPNRKEIPQRTLLEAARLAAFYSSGKTQVKAAVNYTQKKFVNKPKGAAPGLVRLASFKTILVEPVIPPTLDQKMSG